MTIPEQKIQLIPHLEPALINFLNLQFENAKVILEYGCRGSTLFFLNANPGNFVCSCETDPNWLKQVTRSLDKRLQGDRFMPILAKIGPVKAWGYPETKDELPSIRSAKQYLLASIEPWIKLKARGIDPDFVLIDGRFRIGSFLASAMFATKPISLLFDDYVGRSRYTIIEGICKPKKFTGRAALFTIDPTKIRESGLMFNLLPSMLDAG